MLAMVLSMALNAPQALEPALFPRPERLDMIGGAPFVIKKGLVVLTRETSPALRHLSDLVANCTGERPEVVGSLSGLQSGGVVTVQKGQGLPQEGYRLFAQGNEMSISYGGDAGLYYAVQTLRQLLPNEVELAHAPKGVTWTVPAVRVADAPRFSWRGMHIDVSRHFFDVRFIKRYIDYIAMNKMNVFHWHLIDDGGWRMETKKYPQLTTVGAWRAGNPGEWSYTDIRFLFDAERPRYGGFYTQEEIKDVVKYAAERYVTVVPEIEMPGHTTPSIVVFPDLGCDGVAPPSQKGRTVTNVYCAGKESTFAFLENVLRETMDLFPSKWIHIGGDEVDKTFWRNCPRCKKRMADEELKDADELQSYFVRRIEKFLIANGRRLVGWDEILEGGLAPQATVMSWRGVAGGIAAAKAGHDVVMSPTSHSYFDYSYATTSTQHVYGWEPVPEELTQEEAKHVLGGQANVWTEYISTVSRAEYMVFPRMLATAEVLWTGKGRRDWNSFSSRLARFFGRLDAMGANYQIPAPQVDFTAAVFGTSETLTATIPAGSTFVLRYTTDGSVPTAVSSEYKGALTVDRSQQVTFALVSASGTTGDAVRVDCVKTASLSERGLAPGLAFEAYEGRWNRVPQFDSLKPVKSGKADKIDLAPRTRDEEFAVRFSGFIKASIDGLYRFRLGSDDGSYLIVAGAKVVDNDGLHPYVEREGAVRLARGVYPVEIGFFEQGGSERLTLQVQLPNGAWGSAPSGLFLRSQG